VADLSPAVVLLVVYLWLPSVDLALARVAARVRVGGHDVPADTVRRRFTRGREQFFTRYRVVSDTWRLYDASPIDGPRLVASGGNGKPARIRDPRAWAAAAKGYPDE
jgi:predicted ABC-type ATPase